MWNDEEVMLLAMQGYTMNLFTSYYHYRMFCRREQQILGHDVVKSRNEPESERVRLQTCTFSLLQPPLYNPNRAAFPMIK